MRTRRHTLRMPNMGFRFRQSILLLARIRINLGKRFASVSLGGRRAHVTLRPGPQAASDGRLPGTGLSVTEGGNGVHSPGSGIVAKHYNFVRQHKSLRVTPAMAAGVSDGMWSLEELVGRTS